MIYKRSQYLALRHYDKSAGAGGTSFYLFGILGRFLLIARAHPAATRLRTRSMKLGIGINHRIGPGSHQVVIIKQNTKREAPIQ